MNLIAESVFFGPLFNHNQPTTILQLNSIVFHEYCLQENEKDRVVDSTGMRIHAGLHVAVRFLLRFPLFLKDQRVLELGCGTAALGLVVSRGGTLTKSLVLTDGSKDSMKIAEENVKAFVLKAEIGGSSCGRSSKDHYGTDCTNNISTTSNHQHQHLRPISLAFLPWGSTLHINPLLSPSQQDANTNAGLVPIPVPVSDLNSSPTSSYSPYHPCDDPFDVIIGCELLYYRTNIEELLSTVLALSPHGLFIHAHIFRRRGMDTELMNYLTNHGWQTIRVPLTSFVDQSEIAHHGEWYQVYMLISGPLDVIEAILRIANITEEEEPAVTTTTTSSESSLPPPPPPLSSSSSSSSPRLSAAITEILHLLSLINPTDKTDMRRWRLFTGTDNADAEDEAEEYIREQAEKAARIRARIKTNKQCVGERVDEEGKEEGENDNEEEEEEIAMMTSIFRNIT